MVEDHSSIQTSTDVVSLPYTVEERFLAAKTGIEQECEDIIYAGPHFVAVIDGATSKTPRRWDGQTGGRRGATVIRNAFASLPPNVTARQAVDQLTMALQQLYEQHKVVDIMQADPVQRAVASFIAVSFFRREVWLVGDCQCLLNQEHIVNTKEVDRITSLARSLFLEAEIAQGKSLDQLRQEDTGRAFILPLLERQMLFQNNPSAGQYWFPVLDGFHVPDEGIRVLPLPEDTTTIILASDGYPVLKETVASSEQALQDLLAEDPLLFRKYLSTKGVAAGNVSYDDRAYVKIRVNKPN
ncbi:hypothetical protein [Ktedonobacter racemifer]|uniref:PPM-type phosphatase domain-containing protein n=1 Tax=Ktedonobacter racemifer DSM 44963 TaxID=485913 RepID=D6TPR1_KTERA|nr:hypothetical protein [Ktedonobacter racemifer]EFH85675.1 conserved hypothetical protein [Ktedonobacter racemifer DSM 44963]